MAFCCVGANKRVDEYTCGAVARQGMSAPEPKEAVDAVAGTSGDRVLSETEFVAAYRAQMAALHAQTKARRDAEAAAAAAAAAAPAPPDPGVAGAADVAAVAAAVGGGGFAAWRERLPAAAPIVGAVLAAGMKVFFVCLLFSRGDVNSPQFRTMFLTLSGVMFVGAALQRVNIKIEVPDAPPLQEPELEADSDNDNNLAADEAAALAPGGDAAAREALRERRRREFEAAKATYRRRLLRRKAMKCFSTFFVSMFPTWRVETLQAELISDGIVPDPRRPRRAL